jgi:hypothetical protein
MPSKYHPDPKQKKKWGKKGMSSSDKLERRIAKGDVTVTRDEHRGMVMYNTTVVDQILERVANGETLRKVCMDQRLPSYRCVYNWMALHDDFRAAMAEARRMYNEYILDEAIDIADESGDPRVRVMARFSRLKLVEEKDANNAKAKQKDKDMKVVDANPDENGGWKVLENGERANPISTPISEFLKEKGFID